MANIFKQQKDVNNHPKRNNFDLSFQNHLTMKMGYLYPVFCKEVMPGDSFRINSAFGLKFMPLVFPVQSKMRATMHFFYVRNKNLWKDWENWISGLKGSDDNVEHPYLELSEDYYRTGKLADYLNIPSTLAVAGSSIIQLPAYRQQALTPLNGSSDPAFKNTYMSIVGNSGDDSAGVNCTSFYCCSESILTDFGPFNSFILPLNTSSRLVALYGWYDKLLSSGSFSFPYIGEIPSGFVLRLVLLSRFKGDSNESNWSVRFHTSISSPNYTLLNDCLVFPNSSIISEWNSLIGNGLEVCLGIACSKSDFIGGEYSNSTSCAFLPYGYFSVESGSVRQGDFEIPYASNHMAMRLNALPFRAYESIYNAYYRNQVNQPFVVDGVTRYNEYITTNEGSADATDYHLFKRNYELDFLTSALPSPQQGNAPLVGFNAITGQITLEGEDGITTAKADIDDAGNIVGLNVTSPIAGKDHALTLAQIATAGMSINDFRNTNALQRWLETNIRKGYRYLDFISGHFGVTPEYRELDMPEFIGGFSRDVTVSQIVSSADTLFGSGDNKSGASLGQYVGMANCFGGSKHSISHYCDDYGFIMGILSVTPSPAYSQLLPKHYLKQSPLDYAFPEFQQLGMQPITYEEVCPIQAYNEYLADNTKKLTDTFGYQRPSYDLVSSVDEIHGQFRGTLANFLINRVFNERPVLGNDFLQIDPDETNQIFVDQAPDSDNIVGQIIFDVRAKRPLPRVVIPNLGK